jgi:hypothetical protein
MCQQVNIRKFHIVPIQYIYVFCTDLRTEQNRTAIISLYSINGLVFITEKETVYCTVRTEFLYIIRVKFSLQRYS